jgi:hypothetical protein
LGEGGRVDVNDTAAIAFGYSGWDELEIASQDDDVHRILYQESQERWGVRGRQVFGWDPMPTGAVQRRGAGPVRGDQDNVAGSGGAQRSVIVEDGLEVGAPARS